MTSDVLSNHGVREVAGEYVFEKPLSRQDLLQLTSHLFRVEKGDRIESPHDLIPFLQSELGSLEREVFAVIFLDIKLRFIAFEVVFKGTIDRCEVHPREIAKLALTSYNASHIVVAHNHVSGCVLPSDADIQITQRIKDALALLQIRVLDHVIISKDAAFSFSEQQLLQP